MQLGNSPAFADPGQQLVIARTLGTLIQVSSVMCITQKQKPQLLQTTTTTWSADEEEVREIAVYEK